MFEETPSFEDGWAMDDLSGKTLCRKAVGEARSEEMEFIKKIGVYEEVPIEECLKKTGAEPISTRWIDVDKGRGGEALIRSRLVARDFKVKGDGDRPDLFAATTPLEALRMLVGLARMKTVRKHKRKTWKRFVSMLRRRT